MRLIITQFRVLLLSLFLLVGSINDVFSQNILDNAGLNKPSSLAYSLRKLSSTYNGFAVQVRRSSDNALANVSFDANGVVSVNSTIDGTSTSFQSFIGSNSCYIQTWYDQSGNNRHATQTNTSKQPMIVNAGVFTLFNSRAAVNFNGTSSVMNIPMPASVINATGAISTVLKTAQLQQQFEALLSWSSGSSPYGPGFGPQNSIATGKFGLYTTWGPFNVTLGPVAANTEYVLNASWTGQAVTQSRNGNITTGTMGAPFITNVSSGYMGQDNPNSGFFAGTVPEIIVFPAALGTIDRNLLELNQNQFYFPPIIPATGLHFDGINDYVRVADNTSLDFGSQDFTVEAWTIKYANSVGFENSGVVGKWNTGSSAGTNEWLLNNTSNGYDNKAAFLFESGNTTYQISGTTNLVLGNWYHLAAVRKGTSLTLYVNGVAESTITIPSVAVNNIGRDLLMGAYRFNLGVPNLFSKIALDEVRIWKRALCSDELQANKSGELTIPSTLLSAYYKLNAGNVNMNNAGVSTAVDASGNNNSGLLNGFALNGTTSNWVAGTVTGTNAVFAPQAAIITGVSSMNVGETSQFTSNSSGNWTSSNSSIASINAAGLVTAINNGTVNILFVNNCGVISTKSITINRIVAGPAGINSGILMWLDAADLDADGNNSNNPISSTNFSLWKDKSGNVKNAISVPGQNPISFVPNSINGQPVMRFNKVNSTFGSVLQVPGVDLRAGSNPTVTMFTVYKQGVHPAGTGGAGHALWGNDNGAWDRFFYSSWNFTDDGIVSLGPVNPTVANVSGAGTVGKTQLMTAVYDQYQPNGSAIYFNGKKLISFTDNTDANAAQTSLRIGSDGDDGAYNGDIAEFIIYNRKLSDCEILEVNKYLGDKYGVLFTTATITAPSTTVCSGTAAELTASLGDSYQWFKDGVSIASANAQIYNATTAGSYTVAITTSGCTAVSTATVVSVTPAPVVTVTASGPTAICSGTPLVLTASTPNGGFWSTGEFGSSITVYGAGSYTVQISSEDGLCSVTSEPLVVTENPIPDITDIINDGRRDICANTTMLLKNDTPGGVWSSNNTAVATIDADGTVHGISEGNSIITYTITNETGCSNYVTYEVMILPIPVSGPLDGKTAICINETTVLSHTIFNGRDEVAEWTNSNPLVASLYPFPSGVNVAGLTAGTTTLNYYFTNTNGCRALVSTATITVAPLAPTTPITGVTTVCENQFKQLANATAGGVWSSSDTTIATIDATGKMTGKKMGTTIISYTITNASGCSSASTVTVTVKPTPAKPIITGETTGCLGTTLVLTASSDAPNPSFRWCNTPTANPIRTFLLEYSTSLCVNVTSDGCSSEQTIVPVVAKPLPAAAITAVGSTSFCAGSSVQLNASAATGNSYQWKLNGNNINGATAANYIATATGNYTVAVTGVNTCTATSLAITVNATDNVAPGSTAIQFTAPTAILNNVSEAAQYNLAYELNIPEYGNYGLVNPTYTVNNAAQLQNIPIDRIAYYMQLNNKWVWVSMDAFTNNVSLACIPVTNTVFNQKVQNMNVYSSAGAGVTNGLGISTGSIEFWKFNYSPNVSQGLPGASSTTYDFDDSPQTIGNHGSFQVHNYGVGQTIFGYSRFGQNSRGELGIGNNTTANGGNNGNPDWTFNQNAHIYQTKKIYVFVKPKEQVLAKDATIYLDANGQAILPVSAVSNNIQDNCSTVTSVVAPSVFNGSNIGTNTVTLTLTDASGNSNSGTAVVTVKDIIAPVINCVVSVNMFATSASGAIVNYSLPVVTDNAGNANLQLVAGLASGSTFPLGVTTVTYSARDASGNESQCSFTVTVVGVPPVIVVPATIRVDASASNCGAVVNFAATETTAIPASTISYSHQPGSTFPLGTTVVTATATNAVGVSQATFEIVVTDNTAPVINTPAAPVFCENTAGTYTLPTVSATDNCGVASVSFAITGVTQRTGNGFDAGTAFNVGVSTITYTVTDVNGNVSTKSVVVTVNKAPTATIAVSSPDAFCNKLVLVSNSTSAISGYAWSYNNANFASTQAVSLDNTNGDGTYSVYVTDNKGCTSLTAVSYQYSKQNTISNYTILAYKEAELKEYNTVQTGSVGVMSKKGKAEIGKNSSVAAPGAFVKAPKIEVKQGANVPVRLIGVATVSLPTMQYNTSNTNNLPNYTTNQGATVSLSGNYKNLKIRKGSNVTLSGNTYGNIEIEEGSVVRFTSTVINVEHLKVGKGPNNGLTQVRFADNTSIRVAKHVQIEEDCFINPDGYKVTFYLGKQSNHDCNKHRNNHGNGHDNDDDDDRDDDDHDRGHGDGDQQFEVKGGNTTVIANVYAPTGDIKVKGGEGCHKNHTSTVVKMTGLFIGYEVEGDGRNIIWNSYACGTAAPIAAADAQPVYNKTAEEVVVADDLKVTVMPNPSTTYFTLKLVSKSDLPVNIKVVDAAGRLVDAKAKQAANSTLQLGHNYATGNYFAEFIQGNQRKVVQLIKIK
ncbi:LamG-like jellyroll fold domain-containing protein [Sediminibacterium sp.]|uniref:LamG-like jellyroll fold domain-containing protein n=1 Tax=Sediminibacterium sp. TaxID=1917865 RepID=UPI0025E17391|nr:LamG-like jellyroll fold domain-containing protein [Sediminibacterium sp.]